MNGSTCQDIKVLPKLVCRTNDDYVDLTRMGKNGKWASTFEIISVTNIYILLLRNQATRQHTNL